ncbi:hypothetical protein FB107DRAFT_276295 [Schizophyllum commune]
MASKAQAAKEKGNTAFKSGDYVAAVGHYTEAILADKHDPTFFLNRAAAYLKLGKLEDAERDCTSTLAIDPQNVKALFRRGQARQGIGKLEDAIQDLKAALKREPNNDAVKQELAKIEKVTKEGTHSAGKPPRRRVPIEVVDDGPPRSAKPAASDTSGAASSSADKASSSSSKASPSFQDAKQNRDASKQSKVGGGLYRADGHHSRIAPKTRFPLPEEDDTPPAPAPAPQSVATNAYLTAPPKSLHDFSRAMQFSGNAEQRWTYLTKYVDPSTLPTLFQSNLEPPILLSMLQTFLDVLPNNPDAAPKVLSYLDGLSKVSRINMVLLFLSEQERGVVRRLCETLGDVAKVRPWKSVL